MYRPGVAWHEGTGAALRDDWDEGEPQRDQSGGEEPPWLGTRSLTPSSVTSPNVASAAPEIASKRRWGGLVEAEDPGDASSAPGARR